MEGITVSPPFSEVVLKGGDNSSSFGIRLTNNSQKDVSFRVKVVDFGSLDESGGVAFLGLSRSDVEQKYSLASWISLENDWVTISVGETKEVKGKILNRESLSPGGHYGALIFRYDDQMESSDSKVNLNQMFASLIYVKKTGGEKYELKLNRIEIKNNFWGMPSNLNLRYQNAGNIHLTPVGKVVVVGKNNVEVAKGIINNDYSIVLPESFRIFGVPMSLEKRFVWPGKYKLEVWSRYDGKDTFEIRRTDLVYFGWEGIVLLALLLVSVLICALFLRKHRQ